MQEKLEKVFCLEMALFYRNLHRPKKEKQFLGLSTSALNSFDNRPPADFLMTLMSTY